jgi:hypothetical protein
MRLPVLAFVCISPFAFAAVPSGQAAVVLRVGSVDRNDNTGTKVVSKVVNATQDVHTSSAPANPAKTPPTIVDGRFARYLEAPDGRVDGVVLEDGTVARFAPRKDLLDATTFRRGDPIRVGGDLVLGLSLPYLVHASVSHGDVHITNWPLTGLDQPRAGEPGSAKATSRQADGALDTSTTEKHTGLSGSKLKQADDTLVGQSTRMARKRPRLKAAAHEIRRLTTGSSRQPLEPQWSRRREDEGP